MPGKENEGRKMKEGKRKGRKTKGKENEREGKRKGRKMRAGENSMEEKYLYYIRVRVIITRKAITMNGRVTRQ
jgi:hypothetical protein